MEPPGSRSEQNVPCAACLPFTLPGNSSRRNVPTAQPFSKKQALAILFALFIGSNLQPWDKKSCKYHKRQGHTAVGGMLGSHLSCWEGVTRASGTQDWREGEGASPRTSATSRFLSSVGWMRTGPGGRWQGSGCQQVLAELQGTPKQSLGTNRWRKPLATHQQARPEGYGRRGQAPVLSDHAWAPGPLATLLLVSKGSHQHPLS